MARAAAARCSAGSPRTISPPVLPQPKPTADTRSPVRPSVRCSTPPSLASHSRSPATLAPGRAVVLPWRTTSRGERRMKLLTYDTGTGPRAGVLVDEQVLDVSAL